MANAVVAVGAALTIWPLIDNMNPDAAVLSFSPTEADPRPIAAASRITVRWRGGPVFIDRCTSARITQAQPDDSGPDLIDPVTDASRVTNLEWLVLVGVCAHLGCIPLG